MSISIRRFENAKDSELLYELYKNSQYEEFFRRLQTDLKKNELAEIEQISGSRFYTILNSSEEALGFFFLNDIDSYGQSAHYGFVLNSDYQESRIDGFKISFLAFVEFHKFIFNKTQIRKLSARILADRSEYVQQLVRCGYHQEGEFIESVYFNGAFRNEKEYAIFKKDFEERVNGWFSK